MYNTSMRAVESESEFETLKKWEKKVFFKFTASWCKPCKLIDPELHKLSHKYTIYSVDVDKHSSIADEYDINNIPTIIKFENGIYDDTKIFSGSHIENLKKYFLSC